MISIERTMDISLINSIIRDDSIYSDMSDDSCPKDSMEVDCGKIIDTVIFLLAKNNEDPIGCFMVEPYEHICGVHTCLLPKSRGKIAFVAAKKAADWIFKNLGCDSISTYSFSDKPNVGLFASAVGFDRTATEEYPNTRGGRQISINKYILTRSKFYAK